MALNDLPRLLDALPGFREMIETLKGDVGAVEIEGVTASAKGFALARVFARLDKPLLIVTYSQEQAQRLWDDLVRYGVPQEKVCTLPSSQSLFLDGDITDFRVIGERVGALLTLAQHEPCIVIGTLEAALQHTSPPDDLVPAVFTLEAGQTVEFDVVVTRLVEMGYESANTVTRPGEFSRRGGILDVFSSTADEPVRLELFGDEIESIRPFDVATQRSVGRHAHVELAPVRELRLSVERVLPALDTIRKAFTKRKAELAAKGGKEAREAIERLTDRVEGVLASLQQQAYFTGLEQYLPYLVPETVCAVDYLPANAVVVLDEPHLIHEHWDRITGDMQSARERQWERGEALDIFPHALAYKAGMARLAAHPALLLSLLGRRVDEFAVTQTLRINSAPTENYRGRTNALADEVGTWLANDCRVVFVSDQPARVREICADLRLPVQPRGSGIGPKASLHVQEGRLRAGFTLVDLRLYVLTDAELFGAARTVAPRRKVAGGVAISSVLDLREFDYVVHMHHGIGQYRGLVKRTVDGNQRDYLLVQYQGGDRLFVPADQIDRLQRYQGADGNPPQINKLGGNDWQRTTRKVREQAREMAGELIRLYAARHAATRPNFGPDNPWQIEMEEAFPYQETRDQLRAIQDVKADLEREQPMDRLICGDVGFGKTEVALRAAFKVVTAGRQVVVLCPTTVLAAQHLNTFRERFAAYPLNIELLSRFRTKQEQAKTVQGLKDGTVDIVIATHRLLSKDVVLKNLGLVIVDEEQRFGVAHKERLKQLRTQVDVLTLSATPIPRTLSMALSGLRDMSVIEDPPEGRIPVLTFVREYDDELLRDAVLREIERDGQVYYVHNRVESIHHVATHLQRLVPDARILVGHGQMSEDELEKVMVAFYHHEADVLLCTTIIENGLDVSNANTILLDNADHLGLSQLYQLRGRVGRSSRQAYAYLFFRRDKVLTEVAEQRLAAMKEFSALGSGYKVAMRDLEIRGAGNLLGAEQHGAMISVGFDLYAQLLAQAVQELKGEDITEDILPPMDIPVTAHIPNDYISGEAERIYFYKRMSAVRSVADIENLQAELEDRFGDPPRPVWDALAILRLRLRCQQAGVAAVRGEAAQISIKFGPGVRLTPQAVQLLTVAFKNYRFTPDGVQIALSGPKVLPQVEEMIATLEQAFAFRAQDKGGGSGKAPSAATLAPAATARR
jgi:transcription-repair coupling factor (superfamily II helicase)